MVSSLSPLLLGDSPFSALKLTSCRSSKPSCLPFRLLIFFRIANIIECTQGIQYDAARAGVAPKDDSCYLTIAVQTNESSVRYVSLMLDTREDRNSLVTGIRSAHFLLSLSHLSIRTLVSDIHVNATTEMVPAAGSTSNTGAKPERRRSSYKEGVMAEAAAVAAAAGVDAPRKAPQSSSRKGRRGSLTPSTRPV